MTEVKYKNKKLNVSKLKTFGFVEDCNGYIYKKGILDGELDIMVSVDVEGVVKYGVFDAVDGDEYVLHKVNGAVGSYVGSVKQAETELLSRIYNECFETEFYSSEQIHEVLRFLRDSFGEAPEYPFGEETIVMRRLDNSKWYAVFMKISAKKIGLETDETIDVVNLKMKPEDVISLVDSMKYFPAYHMNKKHWVTLPVGSAVSDDEMIMRIVDSRNLVK